MKVLSNKKILILGASGQLGSEFQNELSAHPSQVTFVRRSSWRKEYKSKSNHKYISEDLLKIKDANSTEFIETLNPVVGLMTDAGIKTYKKKKPAITYKNRIKIIEQLRCVDIVLPLNGLRYLEYAEYYKFEYFVHGDDWKKNVQSQHRKKLILLMKKWGGKVLEFPYTKNISSSKIRKKISI